jgi:DNA recombination protein Rad52
MSDFFTKEQIDILNEDLSTKDVKTRKGGGNTKLSYIAAFHAINEANRIFGFGRWSTEIMHIHQADKTVYTKSYNNTEKEMVAIAYTCHLKLTVFVDGGQISHEDMGFGNGQGANDAHGIGSCIELATKEAVTDALKRCLRYYGNKFGLSLYDKEGGAVSPEEIENSKLVTAEQLKSLVPLFESRGTSEQWLIEALKSEGWPFDDLQLLKKDWFDRAYEITYLHKLEDIERESYTSAVNRAIEIMGESTNMNMLKNLFMEAWNKSGKFEDKELQAKAKFVYDKTKAKLEGK